LITTHCDSLELPAERKRTPVSGERTQPVGQPLRGVPITGVPITNFELNGDMEKNNTAQGYGATTGGGQVTARGPKITAGYNRSLSSSLIISAAFAQAEERKNPSSPNSELVDRSSDSDLWNLPPGGKTFNPGDYGSISAETPPDFHRRTTQDDFQKSYTIHDATTRITPGDGTEGAGDGTHSAVDATHRGDIGNLFNKESTIGTITALPFVKLESSQLSRGVSVEAVDGGGTTRRNLPSGMSVVTPEASEVSAAGSKYTGVPANANSEWSPRKELCQTPSPIRAGGRSTSNWCKDSDTTEKNENDTIESESTKGKKESTKGKKVAASETATEQRQTQQEATGSSTRESGAKQQTAPTSTASQKATYPSEAQLIRQQEKLIRERFDELDAEEFELQEFIACESACEESTEPQSSEITASSSTPTTPLFMSARTPPGPLTPGPLTPNLTSNYKRACAAAVAATSQVGTSPLPPVLAAQKTRSSSPLRLPPPRMANLAKTRALGPRSSTAPKNQIKASQTSHFQTGSPPPPKKASARNSLKLGNSLGNSLKHGNNNSMTPSGSPLTSGPLGPTNTGNFRRIRSDSFLLMRNPLPTIHETAQEDSEQFSTRDAGVNFETDNLLIYRSSSELWSRTNRHSPGSTSSSMSNPMSISHNCGRSDSSSRGTLTSSSGSFSSPSGSFSSSPGSFSSSPGSLTRSNLARLSSPADREADLNAWLDRLYGDNNNSEESSSTSHVTEKDVTEKVKTGDGKTGGNKAENDEQCLTTRAEYESPCYTPPKTTTKVGSRTPTPPKNISHVGSRTPTPPKNISSVGSRTPTPPKNVGSGPGIQNRAPSPPKNLIPVGDRIPPKSFLSLGNPTVAPTPLERSLNLGNPSSLDFGNPSPRYTKFLNQISGAPSEGMHTSRPRRNSVLSL